MSDPGGPDQQPLPPPPAWATQPPPTQAPPPPPPPPPSGRPPTRTRPFVVVGIISVAVGVAIIGSAIAIAALGSSATSPSYPDEWAADVLPFAELVERERGIDFDRPVFVDFLDEDAFRAAITSVDADLSADDRDAVEQSTGLFRALGLIEGEVDLLASTNELDGEGIVGFYSYEDKRIRMRGSELTRASKATLVHELTHALQDQAFDLLATYTEIDESGDPAAAAGYDAVVEGDAERIADAYRNSLDDDELAALQAEEERELTAYETSVADVPLVLQTFSSAPYVFGQALLELAVARNGNDAVDRLFDDPPVSEEQLLDPWRLFADDGPRLTTEPEIDDDDIEFDRGTLGAFSLMVVLSGRIDLVDALDAADGWGADTYVAFLRNDIACVRLRYRGDTATDTDEMRAALDQWIDAGEGDDASVTQVDDELHFESCDPGADAESIGRRASDDALGLVVTRTYAAADALDGDATEAGAQCFGDALVHTIDVESLNDPDIPPDAAELATIEELADDCR